MPKTEVTIKSNSGKRTYKGDYVYVYIIDENGEGRWFQEPSNWNDGGGLFFAGVSALRVCAEEKGTKRLSVASRAALDAIAEFSPERDKHGEAKRKSRKSADGDTEAD